MVKYPFVFDNGKLNRSQLNRKADLSNEFLNDQHNAQYFLTKEGHMYKLQLRISVDWIKSESRVFPIHIDPSIVGTNSSESLEVLNANCWTAASSVDVITSGSGGGTITNVEFECSMTPYYAIYSGGSCYGPYLESWSYCN